MAQITEGVYFIQGQDEMIPDSHIYVVGKPDSQDLTIIDAGLMGKGNYKIHSIRNMGIELKAITRIIMTHTHLDHIGCLAEIREQILGQNYGCRLQRQIHWKREMRELSMVWICFKICV